MRNSRQAGLPDIGQRFAEIFGGEPTTVVRAPGRVNLIGEHTDYNDGYVLPVAIDRSILVAAAPRDDRQVVIHALDFSESVVFSLDDIGHDQTKAWSNYQRGVAYFLEERGIRLPGLNAVIVGDVPIGSGLSSSAAVEVSMAYTWQVLTGFKLSRVELALLCQRAESEFVGMNCGIMDQFVSALGQRHHALLIDCRSLDHQPVLRPRGDRSCPRLHPLDQAGREAVGRRSRADLLALRGPPPPLRLLGGDRLPGNAGSLQVLRE